MFNGKKLETTANLLLPEMSAEINSELSKALGVYGIDSGREILLLFSRYFTADFMRQFYDGSDMEFYRDWYTIKIEISREFHFPILLGN